MTAAPDNVINIHRTRPAGDATKLQCECGNQWFTTNVVLNRDGHVTGYQLPLRCIECGSTR